MGTSGGNLPIFFTNHDLWHESTGCCYLVVYHSFCHRSIDILRRVNSCLDPPVGEVHTSSHFMSTRLYPIRKLEWHFARGIVFALDICLFHMARKNQDGSSNLPQRISGKRREPISTFCWRILPMITSSCKVVTRDYALQCFGCSSSA